EVDALHRGRTWMSDVVPDEIESLEAAHRLPDDAARIVVLREIGDDSVRGAARPGDLLYHAPDACRVDVDHGHLRSFTREAHGTGASHARGGRCHDSDLSAEAHRFLPWRRGARFYHSRAAARAVDSLRRIGVRRSARQQLSTS